MWGVILIVTLLSCGGITYGLLRDNLVQNRERLRIWRDAAELCGLQIVEARIHHLRPRLEARAGLLEVRIVASENLEKPFRIVIEAPGPPDFQRVKIRTAPPFSGPPDIQIGHESFDSAFFIGGPEPLVFALLDAETRRELILASVDKQLEISSGALVVELADELVVASILPRLLALRRRFPPAIDIPRRLAENARQDPEDGARLRNLLVLARELPGEPVTREALRAACSDPSPGIQLRAARELGAEGRDTLLEVAELMVYDDLSAQAVAILDRDLPFERARLILKHALRLRRVRTARACLEAIGRYGTAAVEVLAAVMEDEEGELAAAAAQALGAAGSPAAEPSLIRALQRAQADLRVAAANALGRVGSVEAVLPLQEVTERNWLDRELRRAVRQAVAEIQSRLQGAAPGQLSMAAAEAGRLSLARDEAGRLSPAGPLPEESPGKEEAGG